MSSTTVSVRYSTAEGRDQRGRFTSAGNTGRPVGARAKVSRTLLAQVKALGPLAIEKLSAALDAGERWAIEIVLSHVLPAGRSIEFEGATAEDVAEALRAGDLSTSEAKDIAQTIAKLTEISDVAEIRAKLDQLQQILGNQP